MWKRLFAVIILATLLVLSLCAFQEVSSPGSLCEALIWVGTVPVIAALEGAFITMLLEYWPAWGSFAPKIKRPIVLGFCLVVPVLSLIGQAMLCGATINQDNVYLAFVAGITAFTSSQFAHIYKLPSG